MSWETPPNASHPPLHPDWTPARPAAEARPTDASHPADPGDPRIYLFDTPESCPRWVENLEPLTDLTPDEIRGTLDTWERAGYFYSLGEPPSRAAARAVDRRPRRLFWITAAGTACADAQVTTLRERLLKLAVWVERSVRRVVLHLPLACPWLPEWRRLARAVGARP